jgi:hypothetical protein
MTAVTVAFGTLIVKRRRSPCGPLWRPVNSHAGTWFETDG